ncbi:MAG: FKBP-type peptidyl-prolyl cis-trans isomerase [Paludibacteraceae bacterium]|nr:FKBP-type peptidyl-prolyl cis-trans isomerase [Paludibacteraceae bacterium]
MKKLFFLSVAAIVAAFTVTSCKNTSAKMENDVDTISYAAGVLYTTGVDQYINMNVDTNYVEEVYKGFLEGIKEKSDKEKAYMFGVQLGAQVKDQMLPMIGERILGTDSSRVINEAVFFDAFITAMKGDSTVISMSDAEQIVNKAQEEALEKSMEAKYADNKAAGIAWLENNKIQEGVQVTESGLQYKIISLGTGEKPTENSTVKVNYKGSLIDGTEFDSSYKRGEPSTFPLTSVIAGWTEGFQLMPAGTKFELYVPYQLGYKAQDRGNIKPFSTLIFEIEFISIE